MARSDREIQRDAYIAIDVENLLTHVILSL